MSLAAVVKECVCLQSQEQRDLAVSPLPLPPGGGPAHLAVPPRRAAEQKPVPSTSSPTEPRALPSAFWGDVCFVLFFFNPGHNPGAAILSGDGPLGVTSHPGDEITDFVVAKTRANGRGIKLHYGRSARWHKVGTPRLHMEGREAAPQGGKVDTVMMSLEEVGHAWGAT